MLFSSIVKKVGGQKTFENHSKQRIHNPVEEQGHARRPQDRKRRAGLGRRKGPVDRSSRALAIRRG